ncbi:hypothetical protein [Salmonirosea aquatica]|uniref:Outer membrane beta-barrel protein n=1 Tax=Salmonirosea aquatica TaxID=2654236 RepID=A0A7C9F8Z0_9BACT|nr:hypothetical protein [Cytophagaceae bacterium SJW1-29]
MKKLVVLIAFVVSSPTGFAQNYPGVERKGFIIGVGAGLNVFGVEDRGPGATLDYTSSGISLPNLKLGLMISKRTALLLQMPGSIYQTEGRDRSFEAVIPTIQHWLGERFWVSGGAGLGVDLPDLCDFNEQSHGKINLGYALSVGAGYEIVQRKNYAFDIQTRVQYGNTYLENNIERSSTAISLGVGFNWY